MASAARRAFARSLYTRRVFTQHQRGAFSPRATYRPWGHDRIPTAGYSASRSYSGGAGGSSGQNWDGLVYAIMSNIRGEYNFGPECFLSATSADLEEDDAKRRDMRELVPMALNRPWVLATAQDIRLRLEMLCKEHAHSSDYQTMEALIKTLELIGRMKEDNPKLELAEYRSIFVALRNGLNAEADLPFRIISVRERPKIQTLQFAAECVWGVAVLNAALRNLEGEKISGGVEAVGAETNASEEPFIGDMLTLSWKINGLLLDGKDNFPEGGKWFDREQEQKILESAARVAKEASKRRSW